MWYFIHGIDHPHSLEGRKAARPAHLARLEALRDAGRLRLAGPLPGDRRRRPGPGRFHRQPGGGRVRFARRKPAPGPTPTPTSAAGVYARVDVRPFRQVLP